MLAHSLLPSARVEANRQALPVEVRTADLEQAAGQQARLVAAELRREIHRQLTVAQPVLNRLPSTCGEILVPPKIAVIEDDRDLLALLCYAFEQEGFEISGIHDGASAPEFCIREQPDAIVLDVMLPGMDGFSICQQLRQDPRFRDTPVIFLTARTEEVDRLHGLENGGDDYVVKPFSVRELVARVKLRLRGRGGLESVYRLGDLELDIERREVRLCGKTVAVTATEFQLLERMMRQPGHVFSRASLLDSVWGVACNVTDRTVDVHVRRLRRKLEPDPSKPRYIRSVRGFGYTVRDADASSRTLHATAAES